jgi:hypothetical protein
MEIWRMRNKFPSCWKCQEILQFLAGNIAINKDENRKSSFMKVEALIKYRCHLGNYKPCYKHKALQKFTS